MQMALHRVASLHSNKIGDYKRLLSAASSQAAHERLHASGESGARLQTSSFSPAFDLSNISDYIHTLDKVQRFQLLDLILRSLHGSDIWVMQQALDRYVKFTRDIVGTLPPDLSAHILSDLDLKDLLSCRLVSKKWNILISDSTLPACADIWKAMVLRLSRFDPIKPSPLDEAGWMELYKGLHLLNKNWMQGRAQHITQLPGHSAHVTSLKKVSANDGLLSRTYAEVPKSAWRHSHYRLI